MIQLDHIYTADEAAERLRLTNRGVIKLARQYGLCSRRGRDYLFSESDLLALWDVMREPAKAPRPTPVTPALSDYQLHKRLVDLTRKKKHRGNRHD